MLQKFNKKGAIGPAPSPALPAPIPHGPVRQKCPEQPRRLAFRLLTQRVSQRHQPILAHAQSFSLMLNHSKPLRQRHDLSTAGFRIKVTKAEMATLKPTPRHLPSGMELYHHTTDSNLIPLFLRVS